VTELCVCVLPVRSPVRVRDSHHGRAVTTEWQNLPFFCYFGSLIGFGHLGQIQVSEEKN
jgi:hypothetical protein